MIFPPEKPSLSKNGIINNEFCKKIAQQRQTIMWVPEWYSET